jgi:hypothetical protein
MMLLEETRDHLEKTDFSNHIAFESLELYQTIRSGSQALFSNGTQVAFGGQATFSELPMTNQEMLEVQYLSFLGENETKYVNRLRLMGWSSLRRALLMTATGGMIRFANGTMTMTEAESGESRHMDQGMSHLVMWLATMIPVAVLSLTVFLFVGYALRTKIQWELSSSNNSVWKSNKQRRHTASITNNDNSTASSGSVKVAIGDNQRESTIHPALLRIQEKVARAADKV